jgi:hypothetical protein
MKLHCLLFCLWLLPLLSQAQSDSLRLSQLEARLDEQAIQIDTLEARDSRYQQHIQSLEETRQQWLTEPAAVISILSVVILVLGALFGRGWLRRQIKDLAVEQLAQAVSVEVDVLKTTLREASRDFQAKHQTRLLVISQQPDQNARLRGRLTQAGFNTRDNVSFVGIDQIGSIQNIDLVLFNDFDDSKLSQAQIESVIADKKASVGTYFYFGPDRVPLDQWQQTHGVKMGAANFEDSFGTNLLRVIKQHIFR